MPFSGTFAIVSSMMSYQRNSGNYSVDVGDILKQRTTLSDITTRIILTKSTNIKVLIFLNNTK